MNMHFLTNRHYRVLIERHITAGMSLDQHVASAFNTLNTQQRLK